MLKEFLHILRTYFITFRYIKKSEIFNYILFLVIFIILFK